MVLHPWVDLRSSRGRTNTHQTAAPRFFHQLNFYLETAPFVIALPSRISTLFVCFSSLMTGFSLLSLSASQLWMWWGGCPDVDDCGYRVILFVAIPPRVAGAHCSFPFGVAHVG